MGKVLVTGGNGFVGTHLVEALLARGDEVTCLVRDLSRAERMSRLPVKLTQGDVTRVDGLSEAVANVDTVYHLAGATKALHKRELFDVNETGVRNLLTACSRRTTPPVVLSTSSLAAAGPAKNGVPVVESMPPAPVSHYGRSKLAGELVAREFADRLPITIIRPPIVYGEADPYTINLFRPIVQFGVHYGPGLRRSRFSMIHANDLAIAMILAANKGSRLRRDQSGEPSATGVYFVAGDEHPTFREWGHLIAKAFGRRVLVITPPGGFLVWPAAAIAELYSRIRGRQAIFNWDKARETFAGSWWCSDAVLRSETGFAPAATLFSRLQQTADWYRRNGWL